MREGGRREREGEGGEGRRGEERKGEEKEEGRGDTSCNNYLHIEEIV